ncbi:MAG: 4-(cytidine 5'-diphospho)-2-C-methyl-D-erythritol kinase [Chloroflexi bacterium]|nr:4-(cytidine 5'-diphospho)-2-C-methyl-D-erythritol kinase [Chloroflexota bacterium]
MNVKAYAKVNLTLEVLGKRDDGYHEIVSVMQTVDLADEISFEANSSLMLAGDTVGVAAEGNLVLVAATALREALKEQRGAKITLRKNIPIAAGLGGASTDAAATLLGLARFWGVNLSIRDARPLAAGLGSDVTFFLYGGTALAEGRGENISPLHPVRETWLVLAKPPIDVPGKTARLYGSLTKDSYSQGQASRELVMALRSGKPLTRERLFNVFESVAYTVFPGLGGFRDRLLKAGAPAVHLAGSGPTLFAIMDDASSAMNLQQRLAAERIRAFVVKTVASTYNRI